MRVHVGREELLIALSIAAKTVGEWGCRSTSALHHASPSEWPAASASRLSGSRRAALLAAAILANDDSIVATALDKYRKNQTDKVLAKQDPSK